MVVARRLALRLSALIGRFPAVGLIGPRQAGKTTLSRAIGDELGDTSVYLDLELPSDRAKLAEPELYLSQHDKQLIILDEIHRVPEIFPTLRGIIDQRHRQGIGPGQFLILGSASIDLLKQSSESLAGRISYVELTPFDVLEVHHLGSDAIDRLWVRGGFPLSYLAADDSASFDWRLAFIQTYLARDIPALGPRVPAETLFRFWQMLAHNQGQLWNGARLAAGLGVSGQTVARYLDILVDLLLVRRLQPWGSNLGKRLVRSPKVYLRDSGILHALLGIPNMEQLFGHPVVGSSWEGLVIENILSAAPPGSRGSFYRTSNGAEIDLLLELGAGERWAVEVKRSISNPQPSKGFHLACADVQATRRFVVYPGQDRYHVSPETEAIPLLALLRSLAS